MFAVAAAMFGLILVLATLQYRWLGQVSAAERERMKANLATRASTLAQDFDREITRAYLTFQLDPLADTSNLAVSAGERYDRWLGTSRYPQIVKDVYVASRAGETLGLRRFNPSTRVIEPAEWPAALTPVREQLDAPTSTMTTAGGSVVVRSSPRTLWESVPAIVIPSPVVLWNAASVQGATELRTDLHVPPILQYVVLSLDREYIASELLPALADQHFRSGAEGIDYDVAVVNYYNRGPQDRWDAKAQDAVEELARFVENYPASPPPLTVEQAEVCLRLARIQLNRPVPEADPVAYARMKYELENREEPGMMSHFWGVFRKSPDVSMAAKSGTPAMTTNRPTVPASVPTTPPGPLERTRSPPAPGGPNRSRFAPFSSQVSPAVIAIT